MQCYSELAPPTAVSHAATLPFLTPKAHNLIVAKTSLLQIFEFKSIVTEVDKGEKDDINAATADGPEFSLQRIENTTKLILVGEYHLSGTVISLARIKALNTKSGGEALIVAFKNAKLSLIEWDPAQHSISTVSLHYYEAEGLQGAPWSPNPGDCQNYVLTDPSSRCAALKFGVRQLAILPFVQVGDDLVEDDFDPDLDEPMEDAPDKTSAKTVPEKGGTPYLSSFVLPMTALDPSLTHPVHLAFLYEYREPTFGVLASPIAAAASLLPVRKDPLNYTVFTLDLDQRASTTILSISGLPYDTFKVIPLPLPVGGALLVGGNQLIHVDQAGKTNAVSVNEFARQCSDFPMVDQSDLGFRLEGCTIELLGSDSGDMLIMLNSGELAILTFKLDGRTVSGLSVHPVAHARGGAILQTAASCSANVGRNRIFVGCEDGDSSIIGWTRRQAQLTRKKSTAEMLNDDPDLSSDEDDVDDDDIYGSTEPFRQSTAPADAPAPGNYTFRIHDTLENFGPVRDVAFGAPQNVSRRDRDNETDSLPSLEMVTASGFGKAGSINVFRREVDAQVLKASDATGVQAVWSIHAKKPTPTGFVSQGQQDSEANMSADAEYDQYMVVSKSTEDGNEESVVYSIDGTQLQEIHKRDFRSGEGATVDVGLLAGGTRIVQVLRDSIVTYDSELNLCQMILLDTLSEEEENPDAKVISASFADPYVMLLRDDSSIFVFQVDSNGEMEHLDDQVELSDCISGCLYKSANISGECWMSLLTGEGGLKIYGVPDMQLLYTVDTLSYIPSIVDPGWIPKRSVAKANFREVLIADLGDATATSPYLIFRTSNDDLILYQPFHYPQIESSTKYSTNLKWLKVFQPQLAKFSEESATDAASLLRETTLKPVKDVNGYCCIFQTGTSPSFVFKEATSLPRVVSIRGKPVQSFTSFHTELCDRGFAYVDSDDSLRICQLSPNVRYGTTGWATRKVPINEEVDALTYHEPAGVYILATNRKVGYALPKDDPNHQEWATEELSFNPKVDHGMVHLMHPKTWTITDSHDLDPSEVVMSMQSIELEVSEKTHERKQMIVLGTAVIKGEDLAERGRIYVIEVVKVVAEPGRPETSHKLKLLIKEEVKGAVTSLTGIGDRGLLMAAQGQKCMVRGMREDGLLPPVAFMDMQAYVTSVKELKGTGMVVMGDITKGMWFGGFTAEPYRLIVFGKGQNQLEIMVVDFLPFGKQLFLVGVDAEENIHVLQFDPEHPDSLAGQRLIHKGIFHVGHFPGQLTLLQSTLTSNGSFDPLTTTDGDAMAVDHDPHGEGSPMNHLLLTTQSGAIGLITPVDEAMYRRLSALQSFLTNQLEHACGLNPKSYRAVESDGMGNRGMLDGSLLRRWCELGSQRMAEACAKIGVEEWVVRSDLEFVGGGGLAYL